MPKQRPDPDLIRIRHMVDAIKEAREFMRGASPKKLESNRMLALAVIKELEIVGEAASKVSETFRRRFPAVPWELVISMRHRLVHGYYDINTDVVWATMQRDIPALLKELNAIVDSL